MNALDIIILCIIALCGLIGYRRGLIRTVYRIVSLFIALIIARMLYPHVARLLHQTAIFPALQDRIARALNLEGAVNRHTTERGEEIIGNLPLPEMFQSLLHYNNRPDMFALLRVATIEDYITSFFANMVINGIAMLIVFVLVLIILSVIGGMLDIVSMLPIISSINRAGGLVIGLAMGAAVAWVGLFALTLFATGANPNLHDLIEGSSIAQWLPDRTLSHFTEVQ